MADAIRIAWDDDDDSPVVHEDIPVTVPFAYADGGDIGEEEFLARGDVPFGLLINFEDQRPGAITGFLNAVFYDDDNDRDDNDQPIAGTSSLDRWRELAFDAKRRVPGKVLGQVFSGLYAEYASRNGIQQQRPTSRVAPSREQRRRTGRGSTGRPAARASISSVPAQD